MKACSMLSEELRDFAGNVYWATDGDNTLGCWLTDLLCCCSFLYCAWWIKKATANTTPLSGEILASFRMIHTGRAGAEKNEDKVSSEELAKPRLGSDPARKKGGLAMPLGHSADLASSGFRERKTSSTPQDSSGEGVIDGLAGEDSPADVSLADCCSAEEERLLALYEKSSRHNGNTYNIRSRVRALQGLTQSYSTYLSLLSLTYFLATYWHAVCVYVAADCYESVWNHTVLSSAFAGAFVMRSSFIILRYFSSFAVCQPPGAMKGLPYGPRSEMLACFSMLAFGGSHYFMKWPAVSIALTEIPPASGFFLALLACPGFRKGGFGLYCGGFCVYGLGIFCGLNFLEDCSSPCPENCPFPVPHFNHNAAMHVLVCFGNIALTKALTMMISQEMQKLTDEINES